MQWVILLYAFLEYPDSGAIEKVVSRNLPFESYEQCEQFYHQNKNNLIPGVIEYSKTYNGEELTLLEMGCSKTQIPVSPHNYDQDIPEPSEFRPLYQLGKSI
tara:strand:+ start:6983 stop:7288 length:306 start_codon:yes stop_codon:yes gene_type:complete